MSEHPRDLPVRFAEAWNVHDADALAALFLPEARFVNVVGMFWKSRAEIGEAHELAHRTMFRDSRLEILESEDDPLTDDVVAVHAHWRLTGQKTPSGAVDGPRRGVLLFVARRTAALGWQIAVAQNTDILEGATTRPGSAPEGG